MPEKKLKGRVTKDDEKLGSFIKDCRKKTGLNQTDIAEKLDVTTQQFQKYENGKNRITFLQMANVCETMGVSMQAAYDFVKSKYGINDFGFAEAEQEPYGEKSTNLNEEEKLLALFKKIKDQQGRDIVLNMAEKLAEK